MGIGAYDGQNGKPPRDNGVGIVRVDLQHLRSLSERAARGKRGTREVARWQLDVDLGVDALARALSSETYRPSAGRSFVLHDPKRRCIYALPFVDRVAQHLLIDATLPAIERSLAPQSYACRLGKGTHRALARAAELCRRARFVLRVDIQRFFPSIDHALLRRLLDPLTPTEWRWLRDRFLEPIVGVESARFRFPGDDLFTPWERPHGLPIGSLTSQVWANVYLSPIDHLLAAGLGIGSFVRYSDDVVVFHDDKTALLRALGALRDQATALRLRLHPAKTRLHRTTDPVPFVGFVLQRVGDGVRIRLRQENLVRFRRRMKGLQALYAVGAIGPEEVRSRLLAWKAHAAHGHTRALVEREWARLAFVRDSGTDDP